MSTSPSESTPEALAFLQRRVALFGLAAGSGNQATLSDPRLAPDLLNQQQWARLVLLGRAQSHTKEFEDHLHGDED